jgi:hypothetical protein
VEASSQSVFSGAVQKRPCATYQAAWMMMAGRISCDQAPRIILPQQIKLHAR